jgi:hypothetical protein
MRHTIPCRLFIEPSQSMVAHSAASRMWATNPLMDDWSGFYIEDGIAAPSYIWKALERLPDASEPNQKAASLLQGGEGGQRAGGFVQHSCQGTWEGEEVR